jgi:hypothetical protein
MDDNKPKCMTVKIDPTLQRRIKVACAQAGITLRELTISLFENWLKKAERKITPD